MTAAQWLESNQIMDQITKLGDMGKGTFIWEIKVNGKSLSDFSINPPIKEAFEKARLEKIVELKKKFDLL